MTPKVAHSQAPADYLPTLDGWRALAILLVMLHHDEGQLFGAEGPWPSATLLYLAKQGVFGVDLFFGISGFLICSRLVAERRKTGRIDLASFYVRRCFRILPPYLTYLGIIGVLAVAGVLVVGGWEYVSCFLFIRNYLPQAYDGLYTRHFWSLAVEEHFYLIWPCLLALLGCGRRARWTAVGLALFVTAWRGLDAHFQITTAWPVAGNYTRTDTRLDGLFFGCWVALVIAEPAWKERLTRWLSPGVWAVLVAALLAACYPPARVPVYKFWVALLVPLVLLGTVLRPDALAGRFLELPPLRWFGRLSYSLYLWQQLFLVPRPGPTPLGRLQSWPINWLAALACALASYHLVETPMIAWGRRLAKRRQPVQENFGRARLRPSQSPS